MAAPKKSKTKAVDGENNLTSPDVLERLDDMMRSMGSAVDKINQDPLLAALPKLKDLKTEETRRLFLMAAAICERNSESAANLYPFMVRMVREFGLCAVDEAVRMATDLCASGQPQGMVYAKAKEWFEKYGNQDAEYLDALATVKSIKQSRHKQTDSQVFIADLVKPFTNRRLTALSRLDYYQTVRNHCLEHPEIYKPTLILPYFDELMRNDASVRQRITCPDDVPPIDFDYLKTGESNEA